MTALFALQPASTWTLGEWLIAIVIVFAVVGIAYSAIRYFEVPVPQVAWKILGIVLVAALAIVAIRFLLSL